MGDGAHAAWKTARSWSAPEWIALRAVHSMTTTSVVRQGNQGSRKVELAPRQGMLNGNGRPNADFLLRLRQCSRICSAGSDASDGTSGLSRFFVQRPRDAPASEVFSFATSARCERRCHRRGAIRTIRVIPMHPFPLRLWCRPSQASRLRRRADRMSRVTV